MHDQSQFDDHRSFTLEAVDLEPADCQRELSQYLTPLWVAEAIVDRHFPRLDVNDLVLEPSCGTGSFLHAVPSHVKVIGVEIDPRLAAIARRDTGRQVITGDFCAVELDLRPTAVIGNPPFKLALIDRFLSRSHALLPNGGRVGFILPAFALQTARRVAEYLSLWSISSEMIPRNIYAGLREPLVFATFTKDRRRILVGLALYEETADVQDLPAEYRKIVAAATGSLWRAVCRHALGRLGGTADLAAIYRELEGNRPTRTAFWRQKIRQTLRRYADEFKAIDCGRYALADAATAA